MGVEKSLLVICATLFWAVVAYKGFLMSAPWVLVSSALLLIALIGLVQLLRPAPDQRPKP